MKRIHLHTQITLYLVIITLVLQFFSGIILFTYGNRLVKTAVLNNTKVSLMQVSGNIESLFRYAQTLSYSLILNRELQDKLSAPIDSPSSRALKRLEVNMILSKQFFLEQFVRRIYLLDESMIYSTMSVTNEQSIEILRSYIQQNGDNKSFTTLPYISDFSGNLRFEKGYFVSYGRPYKKISDQSLLGHIMIELDYLEILEIIDTYANGYGGALQLFGPEGQLFPMSGNQQVQFVENNMVTQIIQNDSGGLFRADDQYYIVIKNEELGWFISANFPTTVIDFDGRILLVLTLALLALSFVFSGVLGFIIARTITQPIQKLQVHMGKIHNMPNLQPLPLPERSRAIVEIDGLYQEFEDMSCRISQLIHQIHEKHREKNQIEISMLQNRINPHFLYNTLESFTWLARMNNVPLMAEALTKLIRLLRRNVYNNAIYIPLQEEIDFIRDYVDLLSFIRGLHIKLEVTLPAELGYIKILKMLIQPFVENAIFHGFAGKKDDCKIELTLSRVSGSITICIQDNGRGYDISEPQQAHSRAAFSGIGLPNVQSRLQLFYGTKGQVFTVSNDYGTKVTVILPDSSEE